jgi:hypothetical protein
MNKHALVLTGYFVGLGGLLLITYRTVLALSTQSQSIVVQVNHYGEQYLDIVCLVILWIICLLGLNALINLRRTHETSSGYQHDGKLIRTQRFTYGFAPGSHVQSYATSILGDGIPTTKIILDDKGYALLKGEDSSMVVTLSVKIRGDILEP